MTGSSQCTEMDEHPNGARDVLLNKARRLEYFTVGWNVVEGAVAVAAGLAAGSVALLGFGLDSFVESTSGLILLWRLAKEQRSADASADEIEQLDRRAHRLVGATLILLAAYITADSTVALWNGERPEPSFVGLALVTVSIAVMWWLAKAKANVARALDSRALEADSFQTLACWWLSLVALVGLSLNAALGWWWADPVSALGIAFFVLREGREAWQGEGCHC